MRAAALAAVLLAGAAPIWGQEVSLFLGGAHARYADSLQGTAGVASVRLRSGRGLKALDLETGLSRFSTGEWAVQGGGQGTIMWRPRGRLALGVAGGGSLSNYQGGDWSGAAAAGPMLASGSRLMLMLGASIGGIQTVGGAGLAVATGSLRLRWSASPRLAMDVGGLHTGADNGVSYTDLTGALTFEGPALQLTASAGARTGDLDDDPWAQLRMAAALAALRLEAAVGRYPRDLVGFSNGVFVQAGIRVAVGRVGSGAGAAGRRPAVRTERDGESLRIVIRYSGSPEQLGIAGDFSDWQSVPLERISDDEWAASLNAAPGIYHYALVADGEWVLPEGVVGVDDGLGVRVAVLFVTR